MSISIITLSVETMLCHFPGSLIELPWDVPTPFTAGWNGFRPTFGGSEYLATYGGLSSVRIYFDHFRLVLMDDKLGRR